MGTDAVLAGGRGRLSRGTHVAPGEIQGAETKDAGQDRGSSGPLPYREGPQWWSGALGRLSPPGCLV